MQIDSLLPRLVNMSERERLTFLDGIRQRRDVEMAAVVQRKTRAKKKATNASVKKTKDLFAKMTDAEKAELIAMLEENEEEQQ